MSKPKFIPDVRGFNAAMKLPGVRDAVHAEGRAIAADAGEGFEAVADDRHPWVARTFVQPTTPAAHRANARDQLIMRALGRRLG